MGEYKSKRLRDYKGYAIEKTWKVDIKGKQIAGTVIFIAYPFDNEERTEYGAGVFDCAKTLGELKSKINR